MECKGFLKFLLNFAISDLIDTLWNVKPDESYQLIICGRDLIDTLWNVKRIRKSLAILLFGFNRYIVECKVQGMDEVPRLHKGFNRYIVECKGQNGFYSYDGRL